MREYLLGLGTLPALVAIAAIVSGALYVTRTRSGWGRGSCRCCRELGWNRAGGAGYDIGELLIIERWWRENLHHTVLKMSRRHRRAWDAIEYPEMLRWRGAERANRSRRKYGTPPR